MRQLVNEITGRKDFPLFEGENRKIADWTERNLDEFSLNEPHSCSVSLENRTITIRGDKDFQIYKIEKVDFIKL